MKKFCVTCRISRITCHVSREPYHVNRVTCHLSLTPTATATDPPHANFPFMHSRLVSKDPTSVPLSANLSMGISAKII